MTTQDPIRLQRDISAAVLDITQDLPRLREEMFAFIQLMKDFVSEHLEPQADALARLGEALVHRQGPIVNLRGRIQRRIEAASGAMAEMSRVVSLSSEHHPLMPMFQAGCKETATAFERMGDLLARSEAEFVRELEHVLEAAADFSSPPAVVDAAARLIDGARTGARSR